MALNFPDSPIEGETYNGYVYDATNSLWKVNYPTSETISVPDGIVSGVSGASVTTTTVGDDTVYSFLDDGTITVETAGYFDILVVGGGGSGGFGRGGGGGAGGVLYVENAYLPSGSLDVVIGAGGIFGSGGTNQGSEGIQGQNGKPSALWQYIAPGGGGAGSFSYDSTGSNNYGTPGLNGGSGGGGGGHFQGVGQAGGSGFSGIGNAGGNGQYATAAGGGGAGAVGQDGDSTTGTAGNGGNGVAISITGSSVYYGGGGGGAHYGGTAGTGGLGGGGNGTNTVGGSTAGTANTGGGGGGDIDNGSAGGSGIVIVRERGSSGS